MTPEQRAALVEIIKQKAPIEPDDEISDRRAEDALLEIEAAGYTILLVDQLAGAMDAARQEIGEMARVIESQDVRLHAWKAQLDAVPAQLATIAAERARAEKAEGDWNTAAATADTLRDVIDRERAEAKADCARLTEALTVVLTRAEDDTLLERDTDAEWICKVLCDALASAAEGSVAGAEPGRVSAKDSALLHDALMRSAELIDKGEEIAPTPDLAAKERVVEAAKTWRGAGTFGDHERLAQHVDALIAAEARSAQKGGGR